MPKKMPNDVSSSVDANQFTTENNSMDSNGTLASHRNTNNNEVDDSKVNNNEVVIIIEDDRSMLANDNAIALSKQTGFAIAKAFNHNVGQQKSKRHNRSPRNDKSKSARANTTKAKSTVLADTNTAAPWQLVYTADGLVLRMTFEPSWGDIQVDFGSAALQYRKDKGGGKNEAIAKAIGIKSNPNPTVIDCTAGMGNDSFVMASVGAHVTMLERSAVIAALLDDGLMRAQDEVSVAANLALYHQDAYDYLLLQPANCVDVIYLDPMFPHKKKSALVKKEMRAFQQLVGEDHDSERLLQVALNRARTRVVVKRPNYAPPLAQSDGRQPSMAIVSKKHRFDVYLQH